MGQKHHGLDERQDHRGACDLHVDNCEDLAKEVLVEDRDLPGAKKQKLKKFGLLARRIFWNKIFQMILQEVSKKRLIQLFRKV